MLNNKKFILIASITVLILGGFLYLLYPIPEKYEGRNEVVVPTSEAVKIIPAETQMPARPDFAGGESGREDGTIE